MELTPWTVTSKKRKSTPSVQFSGRKRQRRNETPSSDTARQQTLTQAQWMATPTSFSTNGGTSATREVKSGRSKKLKRDSTLTQMDFFGSRSATDLGDNGLESIDEIRPIPQVDGPYQSPRKPRKRKPTPTVKAESTESQEYQPTKRIRKGVADSKSARTSPISTRQTRRTVLTDPAENLDYFNAALEPATTGRGTKRSRLEIQDSTADTDILDLTGSSPTKTPVARRHASPPLNPSDPISSPPIRTPVARRSGPSARIPSSQTPDSVPSTLSRSTVRKPLGERSCNARAPPSTPRVYHQSPFRKEGMDVSTVPTLKRPDKSKPKDKVADSQSNVWSIQATSSPVRNVSSNTEERRPLPESESTGRSVEEAIEVPSTSQAVQESTNNPNRIPMGDFQESSEDLAPEVKSSNLFESRAVAEPPTAPDGRANSTELAGVASNKLENELSVATAPEVARTTPAVAAECDDDFDFDSPIRNDTQFNHEVCERTSSPAATGTTPADDEGSNNSASPTPRPTRSISTPAAERTDSGSSKHSNSLPPPPPPISYSGPRTTRVLLNDIVPSSSPPLQSTKSATQRSVRPASMPHPSQVSTQEATQGYGYQGSSFMPVDTPRSAPRITIKESSSVRVPISQIPEQLASQSQLNIDLGLDDIGRNDPDEEYDLNPPSSGAAPPEKLRVAKAEKPWIPTEPITSPISTPSPPPKSTHRADTVSDVDNELQDEGETQPEVERSKPVASPTTSHRRPTSRRSTTARTRSAEAINNVSQLHTARSHKHDHTNFDDDHDAGEQEPASSPPRPAVASPSPSPKSSPPPGLARPLHEYTQLPGYNNETQSNFTQGGHVSAAYVHRQREAGILPKWYVPKCVKVPGYTRR